MQRAYSTFHVKSADDEQRVIEGIASTPEPDRMGDIVEPKGAEFKLPLPFLWQHDRHQPIGEVTNAKVTKDGISVRVQLAKIDEPGTLKDRLDEAWQSIKAGLVKGLSIGFSPIEHAYIDGTYGIRFSKWTWLELSAVTIPANGSATITAIKSIDAPLLAAAGIQPEPLSSTKPGASGRRVVKTQSKPMKKTIAEQIKDLEQQRAEKVTRRTEIQTTASDEGRTKDDSEREEFDTLGEEVRSIDAELKDLRELEEENKAAAVEVKGGSPAAAAAARAGQSHVVTVKSNLPPGIGFARAFACKAAAFLEFQRGNVVTAIDIAKARYGDDQRLQMFLKAAVPAGTTTVDAWAGTLTDPTNLTSEFVEYLRPMTIIGKFGTGNIPSLRRVPFNIRVNGQTNGGTGYWVGQAKPKPLTAFGFNAQTLGFAKVAAISVLAQELVRFSSPSADMLVRDALAGAVVERIDIDLIDPTTAAVAGVNPASLTNGLVALAPSGTNAEAVRADLGRLLKAFLDENQNVAGLVLIMSNALALSLSLMRNDLGNKEFPDITLNGGSLEGIPVIASQYAANRSGAGHLVIAVNAPEVFLADDDQVTVDVSTEASLEMSDTPTQNGAAGTGASLVSLWQNNLIGFRAERMINWAKRRSESVVYMDDVNWGSIGSPA